MPESSKIVCPHCTTTNRVPNERLRDAPHCGQCGRDLFDGTPVALTAASFERHLKSNSVPVVVDFWAAWCGPCKMMAPHFERATAELEPTMRLAKLDTEAAPEISARYDIRSIPTVIAFRDGRELARRSGAMDAGTLTQWLRDELHSG